MFSVIGSMATGQISLISSSSKGSPSSLINFPKYSLVRKRLFSGSKTSNASRSFLGLAGSILCNYKSPVKNTNIKLGLNISNFRSISKGQRCAINFVKCVSPGFSWESTAFIIAFISFSVGTQPKNRSTWHMSRVSMYLSPWWSKTQNASEIRTSSSLFSATNKNYWCMNMAQRIFCRNLLPISIMKVNFIYLFYFFYFFFRKLII